MIPLLLAPLAVLLGFKHSYDADHLVAVSNILTRSPSLKRTAHLSAFWAVGHMTTAAAVTVALYYFSQTILADFLGHLDLAVAVMLLAIGGFAIFYELSLIHRHRHGHEHPSGPVEHEHSHLHPLGRLLARLKDYYLGRVGEHRAMFGIGIVHGIASNDELLILFAAALSVTSLAGILASVAVFSVGVVLGMVFFGLAITYPLLRWGRERVRRAVSMGAAGASIFYGLLLLGGYGGWNAFAALGL